MPNFPSFRFMLMRVLIMTFLLFNFPLFLKSQNNFLEEQLRYKRVQNAKENYHQSLEREFAEMGLIFPPKDIYLRAFKFDKIIEVWVKPQESDTFVFLKNYDVCETSGSLGPKRSQGDLQIPEGFYNLSSFNPTSNFLLSLKVSYPNASDRILGNKSNLGGDIYIHGKCATVGCLPIEDEQIKELYWLSALAKANGGDLPIHIFPFKLNEPNIFFFKNTLSFDFSLWNFWMQLKPMFDYFETNKMIAEYEILNDGRYHVKEGAIKN